MALKYVFKFSDIPPPEEWSVIILPSSMGWTQRLASNKQEIKRNEKVPLGSAGPKRQCRLLALCWAIHWEAHCHVIRTLTVEWGTEASASSPLSEAGPLEADPTTLPTSELHSHWPMSYNLS